MMTACDSEVLGLRASRNGRSCCQHEFCGMVVVPNDTLHFKLTINDEMGGLKEVVDKATILEEAIKAVHVWDGIK
jgi:hypothetical protein